MPVNKKIKEVGKDELLALCFDVIQIANKAGIHHDDDRLKSIMDDLVKKYTYIVEGKRPLDKDKMEELRLKIIALNHNP